MPVWHDSAISIAGLRVPDPHTISADYTLRPGELAETLALLVEARQPTLVWGAPGSAKSDIARQVAAEAWDGISVEQAYDRLPEPQEDSGEGSDGPPSPGEGGGAGGPQPDADDGDGSPDADDGNGPADASDDSDRRRWRPAHAARTGSPR